ncbi:hypothetical protein HF521_015623 [Silurus meridionalis]|uniref:Uncharacterized protein n=1 Tax=Silurus meridionalis TaxID=175797 RepID=A0A8T0A557_SILME|nr:hypothetical protein HF521_015623 [Silurus meridionalis]
MDGKFPSLGANSEQSHGLAENTHCEHHVLDNTNDISSACGKMVSEENYSKKWDGDVANASPESLHCQGAVARMQEIPPEVASLSTSYASMAYSPDCQQIPSETTPEPIKKSNFPAYQHPSMEDLRDIPDGYIGRKESVTYIYNSVNDQLPAARKENVNSDNPVTKETLEMNNEMELVQDLLVDVCESPPIHDPSAESRAVDFAKSYDPVDNEILEKERRQPTEAQESAVIILSDDTKKCYFVPNQDLQQKTGMEFVDPLIDGLSLNVKVLSKTSCGMHKDSSSVGLHDATKQNGKEQKVEKDGCKFESI